MRLALEEGHVEAAKILARKGADCTNAEKKVLGETYTNFQQIQQREPQPNTPRSQGRLKQDEGKSKKEERGLIRQWMDNNEFVKLREWLGEYKTNVKAQFEAGEIPVVGWLQLAATIQTKKASKRSLEVEITQNAREREQVAQQIKNLQEKQQQLENRNQQLKEQMKQIDEIAALEAEGQSIAMLGRKEEAALAKLEKKMENPYFVEDLDSEDVSTVFSMFNMDSLFPRFKQNDIDNNLEVTATATVEHLQKQLEVDFSEAVQLQWKLKLLGNGEKGEATHLAKCSICSSKPGVLLGEYGMKAEERKEIEAKMNAWKGYYIATVNAASAALELNLTPALRQKLTTCWVRIQKAHKWEHPDD